MQGVASIQRRVSGSDLGRGFRSLYESVFPEWEREPYGRVAERLASGRYHVHLAHCDHALCGFALWDDVPTPRYAVLTFLAVAPQRRGRGIGRQLLDGVVADHRARAPSSPLFVECEAQALAFYAAAGFRALRLDYLVPHYGDDDAEQAMRLLVHDTAGSERMDGHLLREVIRHQFTNGYAVGRSDPRLRRQLQRIPDTVEVDEVDNVRIQPAHRGR